MLANQIIGNVDVLVMSETKLVASFPIALLLLTNLSGKSVPIEGIYAELNFREKNWLLSCTYNPNRNTITNHLDALKRNLDP